MHRGDGFRVLESLPGLPARRWGCACSASHAAGSAGPADPARRRYGGALAFGALLAAGAAGRAEAAIPECRTSRATRLVPAKEVEGVAQQEYTKMLQEAGRQQALAPADHPQLQRLRFIASRITPHTPACNPRARDWRWEVNLIGRQDINAFCMPGGKIGFYIGILSRLQLDDDEVAMIMGHEVAHALLEHAREQMAKNLGVEVGARALSALLGAGELGGALLRGGAALWSLKFSRTDESEADALGLIMAAQAGYNPRAGVSLWRKMMKASGGAPPKFLSTHPPSEERIQAIEARLPQVLPTFESAPKPNRRFAPPPAPASNGQPASPRR